MSRRPRSTKKLTHEALSWLGSYPALLRLEAEGKTAAEKAELAEIAAGMARLHARLWNQWRRKHQEHEEVLANF
jgi:hypothetical protein